VVGLLSEELFVLENCFFETNDEKFIEELRVIKFVDIQEEICLLKQHSLFAVRRLLMGIIVHVLYKTLHSNYCSVCTPYVADQVVAVGKTRSTHCTQEAGALYSASY